MFVVGSLAVVAGSWRGASAEDWIAGVVAFASLPAALTFGERRAAWARALGPLGGILLGAAALTWSVPEGRGWIDVLAAEGVRAGRAWWSGGGAWRWGSLAALAASGAALRRALSSGS